MRRFVAFSLLRYFPLCAAAGTAQATWRAATTTAAAIGATLPLVTATFFAEGVEDNEPCSCGAAGGAGLSRNAPAHPLPPSSVSGVSSEGVYFIPEPLPAEESGRDCTDQPPSTAACPPADPRGWLHPSSYTASILFTPDKHGHTHTHTHAVTEGPKGFKEESKGLSAAGDIITEAPGSGETLTSRVSQAFNSALLYVHDALDNAGSRRKEDHGAVVEGPCRKGRAPTYAERRKQFLAEWGNDYSLKAEETAERELKRLRGDVYLDYAGSALYQEQQVLAVFKDLALNLYGNAHSRNPSAKLTDERTREARELTLKFFGATEEEFAAVFTSGATAAMKMVGEDFPFTKGSSFFYVRINHNSMLGVREFAYAAGARAVRALSEREVEAILQSREAAGVTTDWSDKASLPYCLFGFPLKDNFNGASYPLSWAGKIHKFGLSDGCRWLVLLDAAAAAPTSRIQLSGSTPEDSPDFLATSFYKIFGHPTGLGALVIKRTAAAVLKKVYWGGGSVSGSLCDARWQKPKKEISARLEDGTVNFLSIAAIRYGFTALQAIGMATIERHVAALTSHLFRSLKTLRHRNEAPFVLLYWGRKEDPSGGIVNFNLLKPDGSFVPFSEVEVKTAAAGIHLRTGCFCNPGGCQDFLGLTGREIVEASRARESCSDPSGALLNQPAPQLGGLGLGPRSFAKAVGSVRVSLGYLSTFADVDRLIDFLVHTFLWQ